MAFDLVLISHLCIYPKVILRVMSKDVCMYIYQYIINQRQELETSEMSNDKRLIKKSVKQALDGIFCNQ